MKIFFPSLLLMSTLVLASCGQRDEGIVLNPTLNPEVMMASQQVMVEEEKVEATVVTSSTIPKKIQSGTQVSKIKDRQQFVCKVATAARQQNEEIENERARFQELHHDLSLGLVKEADKLWMIEKLLKYRMIPGGTYYSVSSYTAAQINDLIDEDTDTYYAKHGLPAKCQYTRYERGQYIQYKSPLDSGACLEEFMLRAQVIPEGMAVAQAVLESGWGSSRFAQAGNNTFGLQFSFSSAAETTKRPFCIPAASNPKRCVFKFVSLEDGVTEYFRFLNAGTYQDQFRQIRGEQNLSLSSCRYAAQEVIPGLVNYAENDRYIRDVSERMEQVCPMIEQCS